MFTTKAPALQYNTIMPLVAPEQIFRFLTYHDTKSSMKHFPYLLHNAEIKSLREFHKEIQYRQLCSFSLLLILRISCEPLLPCFLVST